MSVHYRGPGAAGGRPECVCEWSGDGYGSRCPEHGCEGIVTNQHQVDVDYLTGERKRLDRIVFLYEKALKEIVEASRVSGPKRLAEIAQKALDDYPKVSAGVS